MSQVVLSDAHHQQQQKSLETPTRNTPSSTPDTGHSSTTTTLDSLPSPFPSPLSVNGQKLRRPTPSPLHHTFASSRLAPTDASVRTGQDIERSPRTADVRKRDLTPDSSLYSDSSGTATPSEKTPKPAQSFGPHAPNDQRSVSNSVAMERQRRPPDAVTAAQGVRNVAKAPIGAPRTASMDSTISAISSRSSGAGGAQGGASNPADVEKLIAAAGSPEAVIQHLLKDKHSQAQQNAQLWRLVDKQRAMILGLNKDLERALKDKDRYRKKLKEVMAPEGEAAPRGRSSEPKSEPAPLKVARTRTGTSGAASHHKTPDSPDVGADSPRTSPTNLAMAPYPITPPADHPSNDSATAISEVLNPAHDMPRAAEHAHDQYDHEALETRAEEARNDADKMQDSRYDATVLPSRTVLEKIPLSRTLGTAHENAFQTATVPLNSSNDLGKFPPPPVPPPRKAPPAPLQLSNSKHATPAALTNDSDSESEYDDVLQVEPGQKARGRRRTRADDDREREILANQEAEARSQSKKSLNAGSGKTTPKEAEAPPQDPPAFSSSLVIPSDQFARTNDPTSPQRGLVPPERDESGAPPLSPGLPTSPRPVASSTNKTSPPLSPGAAKAQSPPSPRPPRQAIPLPPSTPLHTPTPPGDSVKSKTPASAGSSKSKDLESDKRSARPAASRQDSNTSRTAIYMGLVTDEYPDLLLSPNALPSIRVSVASSRMKPSRASLLSLTQLEEDPVFTLAVTSRTDGDELWRVEKDSASLAKLDGRLKQCAAMTARTPDRSLFTGHAPAKLDARRQALNQYLDEVLETPLDRAASIELCKYLSANTLPPNADETGFASGNTDEQEQKTGPGGRPFKNGYLTKKGKNFGGWKARFFVLDGPHLKYYETPGGAHLGTIKLQNAQIGKQQSHNDDSQSDSDDHDDQYRHAFLVMEPKKRDPSTYTKHYFCAESDIERDQWVDSLLRWIDYRDPGDEDVKGSKATGNDRRVAEGERSSGLNAKKKMYGQNRTGTQTSLASVAQSDDSLIGVSYENTKQGEIPHGAPGRHRGIGAGADSDTASTMSSQPALTISAPRDAHVISDAGSWGGKSAMSGATLTDSLIAPSIDDKKMKKRSFFGFGPKQRSSSDGTDSAYGDNRGSGSLPPAQAYTGPVRQVFGASLAEAVRYSAPRDVRIPLPCVVYRCIQYLDANGAVEEEGIFRLSGSNVTIKQLRERFNTEGDVNLVDDGQYHDIHAVASLLKLYLRELPATILTRDLHLDFLAVSEIPDHSQKCATLNDLVERLPQANATLLMYLIAFLIKVINNADQNKMTIRNVGIVFAPTLNIPAPVFAMFLQNYEAIFGVEPDEYVLPSPATTAGDRSSEPKSSLDIAAPRRPSNSSIARESPHRQLLQQGRHGQTPPGGPRLRHELQHASSAQGLHAGYASQQQHEYQQRGDVMGHAAAYGPSHESMYDQGQSYQTTRSNRRESAVYQHSHGGGMPHNMMGRYGEDQRY